MAKEKTRLGRNAFEDESPHSDLKRKANLPAGKGLEKKPREGGNRAALTVSIREDLIEQARDAVFWTPGLTVAGLVETALKAELDRLEKRQGKPFESRKGELTAGRPVR
jgi:post-segregation antitoxin (ccd killing protein)